MRPTLLICCAALLVSGCNGKQSQADSGGVEQSAGDQPTATNDVTAIDAATGEAANMAADVNYTFDENDLSANTTEKSTSRPAHKPRSSPKEAPTPNPESQSNGL